MIYVMAIFSIKLGAQYNFVFQLNYIQCYALHVVSM